MTMTQTVAIPSNVYARTGNSETLKECLFIKHPSWVHPIVEGLHYITNAFMNVNAPQNTRHLDASEQRVMKNALYRSARLLHKA